VNNALPNTAWSLRIERSLARLERAVSWIWVVLLGVIVINVTSRYVFGQGRIEFEELQWHLYSVGFLAGIVAGVGTDAHVRVDVLRERWTVRTQAWIEWYGLLLFFFPFVATVLFFGVPFVASSFAASEVSVSAGGLPYRWAIKGALTAGFALAGIAGFARLLRVRALLFGVGSDVHGGNSAETAPPGALER